MLATRVILTVLIFGLLGGPLAAAPVFAASPAPARLCLSRAEQSAAVAANKVVPVAAVIRSLHERGHRGEVVSVRLCRGPERMIYLLTLLPRSGRVLRVVVDAGNGELITVR